MKTSPTTYFTAAMLLSLVMLLVYATVQQTYRTAANDPQMQIARDLANNIKYTRTYHYYAANSEIDAGQSLGSFVQLYNRNGQLLYSGGMVNSKAPRIPVGVLDEAKQHTENAVTWQPAPGVRLAAVADYTAMPDTAYVVVARSLQEVESREERLTQMVALFWVTGIGIVALHWLAQQWITKTAL